MVYYQLIANACFILDLTWLSFLKGCIWKLSWGWRFKTSEEMCYHLCRSICLSFIWVDIRWWENFKAALVPKEMAFLIYSVLLFLCW